MTNLLYYCPSCGAYLDEDQLPCSKCDFERLKLTKSQKRVLEMVKTGIPSKDDNPTALLWEMNTKIDKILNNFIEEV